MARKFRRDRMAVLASRLTNEQMAAADEIRDVYHAVTRGLFAAAPKPLDDVKVDHIGRRRYLHPIERMRTRERTAYEQHYRPWSRLLSERRHKRATALQIVLDVIVDGYGTSQVDARYGLYVGQGLRVLRNGLQDYAAIAGWVDAAA